MATRGGYRVNRNGGGMSAYGRGDEGPRADVNLQVADYCAWALYRKWERGDERLLRTMADAGLGRSEARLAMVG